MSVPIWINGLAYLPVVEHEALTTECEELRRRANTRTDALNEAEDRIRSLESQLAAAQESNTYLNNLHKLDADLIRTLVTALRSIPRYAFPGEEERWTKIDELLDAVRETPVGRCSFDTNNGDQCTLPDGHDGNHSL